MRRTLDSNLRPVDVDVDVDVRRRRGGLPGWASRPCRWPRAARRFEGLLEVAERVVLGLRVDPWRPPLKTPVMNTTGIESSFRQNGGDLVAHDVRQEHVEDGQRRTSQDAPFRAPVCRARTASACSRRPRAASRATRGARCCRRRGGFLGPAYARTRRLSECRGGRALTAPGTSVPRTALLTLHGPGLGSRRGRLAAPLRPATVASPMARALAFHRTDRPASPREANPRSRAPTPGPHAHAKDQEVRGR